MENPRQLMDKVVNLGKAVENSQRPYFKVEGRDRHPGLYSDLHWNAHTQNTHPRSWALYVKSNGTVVSENEWRWALVSNGLDNVPEHRLLEAHNMGDISRGQVQD